MNLSETIVHIGPHKTGSTALQGALSSNRALLAETGHYYPSFHDQSLTDSGHANFAHHTLVDALLYDQQPQAKMMQALHRRNSTTRILSSENFSRLNEAQVLRLREILSDTKVRVVYVLRRPDRVLVSFWQEMVKHGLSQSIEEFATPHLQEISASHLLNACQVLNIWSGVFGRESVDIINYDLAVSDGNNGLIETFFNFILDMAPNQIPTEWENRSLYPYMTEIIRALNGISRESTKTGSFIRDRFLQTLAKNEPIVSEMRAVLQEYQKEICLLDKPELQKLRDLVRERYFDRILNVSDEHKPYHLKNPEIATSYDSRWQSDSRMQLALRDLAENIGIDNLGDS
jgi:hypothetical protein